MTDFAKLLVFKKVFANICVRQEQMGMSAWKICFFAKAVKTFATIFMGTCRVSWFSWAFSQKWKCWTIFAKLSNFMFSRIRTNAFSFKPYYLYKQKTDRNFQTCLGIARPWLEWLVVFCKFKKYPTTFMLSLHIQSTSPSCLIILSQ